MGLAGGRRRHGPTGGGERAAGAVEQAEIDVEPVVQAGDRLLLHHRAGACGRQLRGHQLAGDLEGARSRGVARPEAP
jgi:hypothetical protein